MYFNSVTYMLCFLPIVLVVYFSLNKNKLIIGSKVWLVFASIVFYGWWNVAYVPLLLAIVFGNYIAFLFIKKYQSSPGALFGVDKAKLALILGISVNILILGYFKYTDFFFETLNSLFKSNLPILKIILPLAISFHTFQQIAFLVDSYRDKDLKYGFLDYCLFIMFFPQLIVGPIVHHSEVIPQFQNLRKKVLNYRNLIIGLIMFIIGFYKKTIIVEPLSQSVGQSIHLLGGLSFFESWMFLWVEFFHAYLDFSSYMDMALGTAIMFNITLPINFNSPLQAPNLVEFWKRWHITLTRFLREYVYFSMGGSKKGESKTNRNIILTFLLGGLWHGAYWGAILWGTIHGIGLVVYRYWRKLNIKMPNFLAVIITCTFVGTLGLLIRIHSLSDILYLFKTLYSFDNIVIPTVSHGALVFKTSTATHTWDIFPLVIVVVGLALTFMKKSIEAIDLVKHFKPSLAYITLLALSIIGIIYIYNPPQGFLYYQF